ncbi:MAG: hypothetical protein LBR90_01340 [Elusimicrobiota bacterium]|jgi:hypothetical protein|nr:hypothetical protein [Elusimicrobiota bacterium]
MKKIIFTAFAVLFCFSYSLAEALDTEVLSLTIYEDAFELFRAAPSACDAPQNDVVKCIVESLHKHAVSEVFDEYSPQKYLSSEQRGESTLLSQKYKAAFAAWHETFARFERSLPKRPYVSMEQENALWAKLGESHTGKDLRALTAQERDIYKKDLTLIVIKTSVPEALEYLKPYQNALFDSVLTGSPQREKVAKDAIAALLKINRKELDKTIKKVLADFDKKTKAKDESIF